MSRRIVIIVRTILFCVLANVVCSSQYYYWNNARTRNPRYASCPTCHRDCPDALSSPWYSRQSYGEISSNRNYRDSDRKSYGEWTPSGSLSSFYPRSEYGRSTRSGGANPTDVTASGTGNSYQYRDAFEDRQLRRIDPYLASKPPTAMLNRGNAPHPYPFMPMTNSFINGNYERRSHQPGKLSQELADRSANLENSQEFSYDRSNRLNENPYRNKPIGASSMSENVEEDYPKASSEKFLVVYRADGDARSFQRKREDILSLERSDSAGVFKEPKIASHTRDIDGPFSSIDLNLPLEQHSSREDLVDSRGSFGTSNLIQEPEIKRSPYNLSPRLNVAKMMQDVERGPNRDENPVSLWQDDKEWSSEEEIDKSFESLTHGSDYYISPIDDEFAKESTTKNIDKDVPNNEKEKLRPENAIKIAETKGDAIGDGSLKFDPDFMEDIENPPVEPTEPTPTSEPTESSMTTKHSR